MARRTTKEKFHYFFILPAFLMIFITITYPFIWCLWNSTYHWILGSEPRYVGLYNYYSILLGTNSENFWHSIIITIYLTVGTVFLQLVLGIGLALIITEFRARVASKLLKSICIIPMALPPVVTGLIWGTFLYNPTYGLFNYFLSFFGIPPQLWTYSPSQALPSIMLILVWQWTPFVILMILAGLESLPTDPVEAALIDGASRWQVIRYIKLPLLKPIILAVAILRTIDTLRAFDIIISTTLGGPGNATEILNIMTYLTAFTHFNIGVASALGTILFLISLITVIITLRILR